MVGNLPLKYLAAAFLLLSIAHVNSQVTGIAPAHARIVGTVLDQQSQPLKNMFVHAFSEETRMYMPTVDSDEDGHFAIEELQPGTYDIFGENGAAGYPDTALSFYSNETPVKATVRDYDTATIVLVLGPRAGVLRGEVLDKTTGTTIVSQHAPHFNVRKVSNREDSITFMGPPKFRWLIPPATDVTLEVVAEGYKPWVYADPWDPSKPMPFRFESGEERILNIELEPETRREQNPE